MGQKIHPGGLRVGVIHDWKSNWMVGKKEFAGALIEDIKIREHILKKLSHAGLSDILIRKDKQRITIDIYTARRRGGVTEGLGASRESGRRSAQDREGLGPVRRGRPGQRGQRPGGGGGRPPRGRSGGRPRTGDTPPQQQRPPATEAPPTNEAPPTAPEPETPAPEATPPEATPTEETS